MKRILLKSFLVAISMVAGINAAWADTFDILYGVPVYDTDETTILSVNPQTDFAGDANESTDFASTDANGNSAAMPIEGSVLKAGTSSWTKYFTSPVTEGKVYFTGNHTVSANNDGTWKIVDSNDYEILKSINGSHKSNGDYAVFTVCGTEIINYVRQPRGSFYGIKSFCIDLDARVITYEFIISSGNGSYTTKTGDVVIPDEVTDVNGLKVTKTTYGACIDNVSLYNQKSSIPMYEYKVNYKLGDDVVDFSSAKVVAGTIITAESMIYVDGEKYFIEAETAPTLTVSAEGTNILDVPVRKAYTATLNVNTVIGGTSTISTVNLLEADDKTTEYSYSYSAYAAKEGVYYSCDESTYVVSGSFTDGQTIDIEVNYSTPDESIVFFGEAESVGHTIGVVTGDPTLSGGGRAAISGDNKTNRGGSVGTFGIGKYLFVAKVIKDNGRDLHLRDQSSEDSQTNTLAFVNAAGLQTAEFTLYKETAIVVNGKNQSDTKLNQSDDFDYILIKRVGDATLAASVTEAGLATFCPEYTVDFTDAQNIAAYKASIQGSTVNLTRVNTVAAGEGVMIRSLNGGAAEVALPVIASVAANEGNAFVGTLEDITVQQVADGMINYVLSVGSGGVGFYKAKADGGTLVGAGKAYLPVAEEVAAEAKLFSLNWGDDEGTTGISTLKSTAVSDDAYYTLQGVRVNVPTKGLYIRGGKKVIVK